MGTRGSALALWQAERVRALLSERGVWVDVVVLRTSGDEDRRRPPGPDEAIKGLFTKELEEALLDGRIDAAVHSLKDVAATLPEGLALAAYPERADPRDALVSKLPGGLTGLPAGARVGTSSLRRVAAVRRLRPDVEVVPLRGNVPTRLARVDRGEVDAAVLALAGLRRLGLGAGAIPLEPATFVPAPGQGALAIETRRDDPVRATVAALDNPAIRLAVEAERAVMEELEGGCRVPLGAICLPDAGRNRLTACVWSVDGQQALTAQGTIDPRDPRAGGVSVARELLAAGAAALIRQEAPRS
jgi:hydroxymethylbilane synthase